MNLSEHVLGILAALGSAASWALGTILFKEVGRDLSPTRLTLLKSVFSLILLAGATALVGWTRVTPSAAAWLGLSGLLGICLGDTCFFLALKRLAAHQLVILMMLGPALTVLLVVLFLGEKPSISTWTGMLLVLFGVGLTLGSGMRNGGTGAASRSGVLFGFLSILCMGTSVVIAKIGLDGVPALQAAALRMFVGCGGMVMVTRLTGEAGSWTAAFRLGGQWPRFGTAVLVVTFGGFWLSLLAIKLLDASVANTLIATEPLFALPLAAVCLGERPLPLAWGGAAVAFPGAILLAVQS